MKHWFSIKIFIAAILASFFIFPSAKAVSYPQKANYFLNWSISDNEARDLAKWDLLILDMETQVKSKAQLQKIRSLNPKIKILVYITPQEIRIDASGSTSAMRRKLAEKIPDSWYLKDTGGNRLSWWQGTYLLNVTNDCPQSNNLRFNQYLVNFVNNELLSTGLWDGVFYDNAWDGVTNFVKAPIASVSGSADNNINQKWKEGMKFIYNETRRISDNKFIIVGNGTTREYKDELNGKMIENFFEEAWGPTMNTYAYNFSTGQDPKINIINANTGNTGNLNNFKHYRFSIASSLMENGYYSFDHGDQNHGQVWWYDEYDVKLGEPLNISKSQTSAKTYVPDVWKRDFVNGLAIVNSTPESKKIALDGDYEKIHGLQDKKINDGSIVSETAVDGYDGLILLKTFATLQDVLFQNGSFVRFFRPDGSRVRNGFFVFEAGYKGGDRVAHIDLDGNGQKDLLVVSKNKIMAWRDDGQIYMKDYPYTINYRGELKVAIGDLNKDSKMEIYIAPSAGYPAPIKIYTRHGRQMKKDWYPLGEKYSGGYSLAVREVNGTEDNQLIIGAGSGIKPSVYVYDDKYNLLKEWLAFESGFRGGISVATGNIHGDERGDEIIVGAGPGKKPQIKVFDIDGKQLNDFIAYDSFNTPGIEVLSTDVDFDGKDDIIGMGAGL